MTDISLDSQAAVSGTTPQVLRIRRASLALLHKDPANARLHGPLNLDAIKASLQRFGQAELLVVHAGTRLVIAGNGRLLAVRDLGWTGCDIVELEIASLDATVSASPSAVRPNWPSGTTAR